MNGCRGIVVGWVYGCGIGRRGVLSGGVDRFGIVDVRGAVGAGAGAVVVFMGGVAVADVGCRKTEEYAGCGAGVICGVPWIVAGAEAASSCFRRGLGWTIASLFSDKD